MMFAETKIKSLIEVSGLKKYFPVRKGIFKRTAGWIKAVDGVSLRIKRGETLGLVGESGCGKSTIGRCILKLYKPSTGSILYEGRNIDALNSDDLKVFRRKIQAIFQDPYTSLNPRMSVQKIIGEPLVVHSMYTSQKRKDVVEQICQKVGLRPEHLSRYPHEFSGGQRQRIGIARALTLNPDLIVCDEPVSALDVSIRAQVINLLDDLKHDFNLSYLFIAHDLSVVEHVSDSIAVMYLGKIVEFAKDTELYSNPAHPYTKALLSAIPIPDPTIKKARTILKGDVPSPINPPKGCRFHNRCPQKKERCSQQEPQMREISKDHYAACFYA